MPIETYTYKGKVESVCRDRDLYHKSDSIHIGVKLENPENPELNGSSILITYCFSGNEKLSKMFEDNVRNRISKRVEFMLGKKIMPDEIHYSTSGLIKFLDDEAKTD